VTRCLALAALLLLTGCARRHEATLVVAPQSIRRVILTEKTKCRQISATRLVCDGVEMEWDGTVTVKK